ncbi:MAG: hypothetical protein SFV21_17150, partial [Rhodospirillaceae bacterium]|nr:hypothetical protein [Rhodospirillaceae bacterium]
MTRVAVGDKLKIGPYEVALDENAGGARIVLSVELVQPLEDDLDDLVKRSRTQIGRVGLSMRTWSWGLAVTAALVLFMVPWVASFFYEAPPTLRVLNTRDQRVPSAPTTVWTSGGISSAHKFFGDSCETCHEKPFVPVEDGTCLVCHSGIEHHADPARFKFASFEGESCQSCHKEHQGSATIARSDQGFCVSCHGNLDKHTTDSKLRNVTDFGRDHPDFRPTVLVDSALQISDRTRSLSDNPPPTEDSSLDFPHDRHLRATGVKHPERGNISLKCTDCHEVDAGGAYMLPLEFEKHCHQCHKLKFDVYVPDRELLHGMPEEMFAQVRDVYDAVAMRGGYEEPAAPELIRRRPGTPLTAEEKKEALDWSAAKTAEIIGGRFGRGLCDSCHQLFETTASAGPTGGGWGVEPVSASNRWFPAATFSHGSHRDVECGTCHEARQSTTAQDVIMPHATICQNCHGGEHASNRVPSTCISCHVFHQPTLEPMRPIGGTAAAPADGSGHGGTQIARDAGRPASDLFSIATVTRAARLGPMP